MSPPRIDNRAARRHFLDRHALIEAPAGPGRGADLAALIARLGFVQLDSVCTVARAHDMILHARRSRFRPGHLKRLYETDRALFEHWTHDAAMIPMPFYPHWRFRFARDAELLRARWRNWRREGFEDRFDAVLRHIRDHGPVTSGAFGGDEPRGGDGWWDWHPSKTALEYLWRSGALTVVGRTGFQKRYDLTERVIDAAAHPAPDPQETIDWLCGAALDRLGFATSGEIAAFWDSARPAEAKAWCVRELAAGRIEPLEIVQADGRVRRVHARPGLADIEPPTPGDRIRVLSPFDPALRDRSRAERLFGFHYRIEIYVPAARRRYGYYIFPLLEGDRLIGRIDMRTRREADRLEVSAMWPERGVRWGKGRQARLEAVLDRVARFSGVNGLTFADGWLRQEKS